MIKITIIIILILLLLITLYSYYCLSSRMIEFERIRLDYILNKENELKILEKKIKVVTDCSDKNDKYQQAITGINTIIDKLNLPPGSICKKYSNNKNNQTITNIKSIVPEENPNNLNNPTNNLNIYHEVPLNFMKHSNVFGEITNNNSNITHEFDKNLTESESESESE